MPVERIVSFRVRCRTPPLLLDASSYPPRSIAIARPKALTGVVPVAPRTAEQPTIAAFPAARNAPAPPCAASVRLSPQERRNIEQILDAFAAGDAVANRALALNCRLLELVVVRLARFHGRRHPAHDLHRL